MNFHVLPEFQVKRNEDKCTLCRVCERECSFGVHHFNREQGLMLSEEEKCVGCQRCSLVCPARALSIVQSMPVYKANYMWARDRIEDIKMQALTGGVILTGCGNDRPYPIYWDHLLLNASQVTNPSIDPLREPMEIRTFLGRKPDFLRLTGDCTADIETKLSPNVVIETPIVFAAMSYGAISYQAFQSLATAAKESGTLFNTGEGGLPRELQKNYGPHAIVQCASGRFGVDGEYFRRSAIVEIKIGQGAKPGIGGHLPGEKVSSLVAETRGIPLGADAISPAPQHDIYSIEDLGTLIYALKEVTDYEKPVSVKIAAVHNSAAIASGIVRAGADIIAMDGFRGGTGAAPKVIRDNVGVPIELALASVDSRLREEGIRNRCSLLVGGGIRSSADIVKAIALGADGVFIGTAALLALGCTLCQKCYTGKCNWGICTQDPRLAKRLDPVEGSKRLKNLLNAWNLEIKEMLGGMGLNAIESLRGNRDQLRGIDLHEWELDVLGVKGAGE
jgi:glutamate synthase domain-containing protein 2